MAMEPSTSDSGDVINVDADMFGKCAYEEDDGTCCTSTPANIMIYEPGLLAVALLGFPQAMLVGLCEEHTLRHDEEGADVLVTYQEAYDPGKDYVKMFYDFTHVPGYKTRAARQAEEQLSGIVEALSDSESE
jgi:hypothetical protein